MNETYTPKARRLNPFAFPSETNVRFTLLIITALVLTFGIASSIGINTNIIKVPEYDNSFIEFFMYVVLLVGIPFFMCVLAIFIYRSYPKRVRRVKNLRLMIDGDDPQFARNVKDLVSLSGVSPPPSIEMARNSHSLDGQAFGLRNRYALRLGGGLRLLLRRDPASFKAIVLHELAHIANKDVTRAYFVQGIWIAFIALTVSLAVAYIIYEFTQSLADKVAGGFTGEEIMRLFTVNVPTVVIFLFQVGMILIIAAAIRSSVLRAREIYADWQARLWGVGDALVAILRRNPSHDKTWRWSYFWRLHPTPQERLDALEYPEKLFQVKPEVAFFVGASLGFLVESMFYLGLDIIVIVLRVGGFLTELIENIILLLSSTLTNNPLLSDFISFAIYATYYGMLLIMLLVILALGAILAYSLIGALGLEIQREAVADMVLSKKRLIPYLKLWQPAALFVFGFLSGYFLKPFSLLSRFASLMNLQGLIILLMTMIIAGTMMFLIWLGLVYIRFFARRLFGSHFGKSPPHGARRLFTLLTSGWLLIFFPPVVLWHIDITTLANNAGAIIFTRWAGALAAVTMGILFQYTIVFGVTWLLVQTYRLFRQSRCPSCNQITKKRYAVGEVCEHCGKDLAPWLFVNESPTPNIV